MDINKFSPQYSIEHKHCLQISDFSTEDIYEFLSTAKILKRKARAGEKIDLLKDKIVGTLFNDTTARTRLSFEIAIQQLGGSHVLLTSEDAHLSHTESIQDTAWVLRRYGLGGLVIRGYSHRQVSAFARTNAMPVINGLSDTAHPCQVLADLFTIWEHKGTLSDIKLAYVGDGNNLASSLIMAGIKCDMNIAIACPSGYTPPSDVLEYSRQFGDFLVTDDPVEAVRNADIVYTDRYAMFNDSISHEKKDALSRYQVNVNLMRNAKRDALFMHSLPAIRGVEVSKDIIDGPQSIVYDQAENRVHMNKAILGLLIRD